MDIKGLRIVTLDYSNRCISSPILELALTYMIDNCLTKWNNSWVDLTLIFVCGHRSTYYKKCISYEISPCITQGYPLTILVLNLQISTCLHLGTFQYVLERELIKIYIRKSKWGVSKVIIVLVYWGMPFKFFKVILMDALFNNILLIGSFKTWIYTYIIDYLLGGVSVLKK